MTAPPQDIPTELADLSSVSLAEMPDTATLGTMVQRVLPGRPVVTVPRGAEFSSSI